MTTRNDETPLSQEELATEIESGFEQFAELHFGMREMKPDEQFSRMLGFSAWLTLYEEELDPEARQAFRTLAKAVADKVKYRLYPKEALSE